VLYTSIKAGDEIKDFKIEAKEDGSHEVTCLTTGQAQTFKATDFDLDYGTILRFKLDGAAKLVQFLEAKDNLNFNFYYKGNTVQSTVYDAEQFALKKYMAPPKHFDSTKNIISPMPGSIVSVSVEEGQSVSEGQELLIVEAMKMQNIIKSEIEGKVKKVNIKPGQSVAVDELLIEFA
jgi:biotin carboxyl carrier protein